MWQKYYRYFVFFDQLNDIIHINWFSFNQGYKLLEFLYEILRFTILQHKVQIFIGWSLFKNWCQNPVKHNREIEKYFENIKSKKTDEKWNGWFMLILENDTVKADFFLGGGIDSFTFLMVLYVGDSKITILLLWQNKI